MKTIQTYDNTNDRQGVFSQNSGLLFASDPSNCTINTPVGLIVSGSQPVMGDIHALDNLSDEIGITHETIEAEIIENSINE